MVAEYLDRCGVRWCHVPNGGARNAIVGAQLKRLGVKRGVPDVIVFDRPPKAPDAVGVAMELKAEGGRLTPEQRDWIYGLNALGWYACVCTGAGEAIEVLERLGYRGRAWARLSTSHGIAAG